ncbi:hypothetical protein MKW92_021105 [Papaver armeniacum]|nr:hypothetical protein MKW92_021105 [Papaver armeniacum]
MSSSSSNSNGIIGGIWPSWYADKKPPSCIPALDYTHVFYAFVNPDPAANFTVKITPDDGSLMLKFTGHLHSKNSSVKAFLGTGGAGKVGKEAMPAMTCKQKNRRYFIESIIKAARKYNFDGVNLGWEFPEGKEGMNNLVSLLTELRAAVDQEDHPTGKAKLGISISVFFAPDLRLKSSRRYVQYPAETIAAKVDFVNVMCYDYAGYWDTSCTGSIAALKNKSGGKYCTSYGIQEWIKAGVPSKKLVMGLPLYGRTWKLRDQSNNGIGAPAVGIGPQDGSTEGYMLYHNVVAFNKTKNATEVYDNKTESYYSYSGTDWISYDGVKSVKAKVKYAKDQNLGGYYFFSIGQDSQKDLSKAASEAWRN